MNEQSKRLDFKALTKQKRLIISQKISREISSDLCGVDSQILNEFKNNQCISATKI